MDVDKHIQPTALHFGDYTSPVEHVKSCELGYKTLGSGANFQQNAHKILRPREKSKYRFRQSCNRRDCTIT